MHGGGNRIYGLMIIYNIITDCLQNAESSTIFQDFVVQGQGLVVRGQGQLGQRLEVRGQELGQGIVIWSLRILEDKDFPREQQNWYLVY